MWLNAGFLKNEIRSRHAYLVTNEHSGDNRGPHTFKSIFAILYRLPCHDLTLQIIEISDLRSLYILLRRHCGGWLEEIMGNRYN